MMPNAVNDGTSKMVDRVMCVELVGMEAQFLLRIQIQLAFHSPTGRIHFLRWVESFVLSALTKFEVP